MHEKEFRRYLSLVRAGGTFSLLRVAGGSLSQSLATLWIKHYLVVRLSYNSPDPKKLL